MSNDLTQVTQRSLDEQVIGNLNRLQEQGLEMPPGYSPQNALKSAFFELTNNSGGNLLQLAANNPETKTSISISDEELEEMIEHIVKYMPSAFNSQSTRIVLLLNDQHIKFWENAKTVLKDVMGPDRDFEPTNQRINGFEHAYGTILYFEDEDVIKSLQEQMPSYADNFANWAVQTNAMYQYAIWTALSSKGIGASLQHYNPLVDQITAQTFDIPASWKLVAQMPFGDIEEQAGEKEIHPTDQRFIIKK